MLRVPDPAFSWHPYLGQIERSLKQYGITVGVLDKSEVPGAVKKAFIKDDSMVKLLSLQFVDQQGPHRQLRIKLEIDTNPPEGSGSETKFLNFPTVSSVSVQDKPSLFAGKSHALLCRKFVKGRDWYDFLWYIQGRIVPNYAHLSAALNQAGPWVGQSIKVDTQWYQTQLAERIRKLDWKAAREDVRAFLPDNEKESLRYWGPDLFLDALNRLLV